VKYQADVVEPLHANLFGPLHADYYDSFNRRKDYRAEVDQLCEAFVRGAGQVSSVLDLGCGTGRHLELLAASGFEVVGVDRSPAMAQRARERLARFSSRASVVDGDLFELDLGRTFDAVIMMFSVFGYFVTNERLIAALRVMRRHLAPGGLVAFDVEDAAAALRADTPMSGGELIVPVEGLPVLAGYTWRVNPDEQAIVSVEHMWQLGGDTVVDWVEETHVIRYFLPRELRLLLGEAGFELAGYAPLAGVANTSSQAWLRLVWARRM
jgi:SAM-dependent methyltransferase